MPCPHVDLNRRQNQPWHVQGRIPLGAHFHELFFGNAFMDMNVRFPLLRHRSHVLVLVAARCLVIVAQENPGFRRQRQYLLDGLVQGAGITTWEITTGSAEIGHKQGVANKRGITNHIGQARGSMARGVQNTPLKTTNGKGVAFLEQLVELAAVALELGAGIKRLAKYLLNVANVRTDTGFAAQFLMQVGRRRQVICVDVGFQDPLYFLSLLHI